MTSKFTKGDKVSQVQPVPITGVVDGFSLDQETGAVHVKVKFKDAEGNTHIRDFLHDDLEAVSEATEVTE